MNGISWLDPDDSPPAPPRDHYDAAIEKPDDPREDQTEQIEEWTGTLETTTPELGLFGKIVASIFVGVPIGILWLGLVVWLTRMVF